MTPSAHQAQSKDQATQSKLEVGKDYVIVHHEQAGQWEVRLIDSQAEDGLGNVIGYAAYDVLDEDFLLTHTVVAQQYQGRGIAGELMHAALEDIKADGKKVVPLCSYASSYIERHPEYQTLVSEQ
ncbi:MAG: GNAT family N-acetyltransferase [Actinomycetaceae bacterium]|nr:N-acetyltransferase [Arcanobacterium sp.]MDD7687614.1 GNAT family N-acetyltransferase [Actinomycetaceae bacterium]MDY5273147.1 GNAT family N-acetyltransferase [Arcanobacterium sp.]